MILHQLSLGRKDEPHLELSSANYLVNCKLLENGNATSNRVLRLYQ